MTDSMPDPFALRNIPKGDSPNSISGMEFLRRYHACSTRFRQGNESHPLRLAEQADTRAWLAARQPVPQPVSPPRTEPYPKRRIKPAPKRPDSDGIYRL